MAQVSNNLVSSDNVNGTSVYSRTGDHIGDIDHLMIEKSSGRAAYAVIGFGGLFGIGEDHYPIPWNSLKYDVAKDGYITDVTREQVEGAPQRPEDWSRNRDWETRAHSHYGVPHYWV